MSMKLTIILGAGASNSLNPDSKPNDHQEYRPPLAKDIFKLTSQFRAILHKYTLAETLASDIDRRLKQNKDGLGLEQILKSYEQLVTDGKDTSIARQFLQIPLYLNNLFGEISSQFTVQPDEYNNLVNLTTDKVDEVLFLTLNYDNLLEIPLSNIYGVDFSKEDHYIGQKGWCLVKLHGSINWYREFASSQIENQSDDEYLSFLRTTPLPLKLKSDFTLISVKGYGNKYIGDLPVYPALTVPVDGKYDINCPPALHNKAKEFLSDCHNYLIIGTSGKDQDLLDLLKDNAKGGKILVVGREEDSTNKTRESFMLAIPQFQSNISTYFHQRGFSEFVDSGELDSFLDKLV